MLGLGRALGETIAVALIIGQSTHVSAHLLQPGATMASTIALEWEEASGLHSSALIALGVVLFAITIIVNSIARGITCAAKRGSRHEQHDRARDSHLSNSISVARRSRNWLATTWMVGSVLLALIPLFFIMLEVVRKGFSIVVKNFPDFLTKPIQVQSIFAGGGMGPAIVGTVLITGVAALIAIPLGVLAAIYLNEYGGKGPFVAVLRFFADGWRAFRPW